MTRFSITLEQGVKFVLNSISVMQGGEIFVPKIPSFKMFDLIKAFGQENNFKIIGIRSGEKIHEQMISDNDNTNTLEYKNYFIIFSDSGLIKGYDYYINNKYKNGELGKSLLSKFSYSSDKNKFLSVLEIKKLIKNNT
jgi:UDP-N-acetylglucosamine 4,6-dehydratase